MSKVLIDQERAKEIVQELSLMPKRTRVWEIDALRGFLILLVVFDHLMWDIRQFGSVYNTEWMRQIYQFAVEYRTMKNFLGTLRGAMHDSFVMTFVLLSGISCSFSRSNARRAVKMIVFAIGFSAVTYGAASIFSMPGVAITFNIIHVIASCVACWALIELIFSKVRNSTARDILGWLMLLLVIACLVLGYYFKSKPCDQSHWWAAFVAHSSRSSFSPGDYLPLLPALGWFLMGAFVGKKIYKSKTTLFPLTNDKIVLPLTICGRYSLWIYFGSQVLMYGILYLFARVLGVL